jgi:hypothetical protein
MDEQRKAAMWKLLNKYGVYTEEELREAHKNLKPLDIGIFTLPPKGSTPKKVG